MTDANQTRSFALRIDHVMLPVRDLDRALALYTGLLSMRVLEQRQDSQRRIAHVGYGARGAGATLELIEMRGAAGPVAVGGGHLCLRVRGLSDLIPRLQAADVLFDRPLSAGAEPARVWIRDGDGHLLEISEEAAISII